MRVVRADDEGVEKALCEVDEELGDCGAVVWG